MQTGLIGASVKVKQQVQVSAHVNTDCELFRSKVVQEKRMGRDGLQVQQTPLSNCCISTAVSITSFYVAFVSDFQRPENIVLD